MSVVMVKCPNCSQICNDCFDERKQFLGGVSYRCKNCGSDVKLREETT